MPDCLLSDSSPGGGVFHPDGGALLLLALFVDGGCLTSTYVAHTAPHEVHCHRQDARVRLYEASLSQQVPCGWLGLDVKVVTGADPA